MRLKCTFELLLNFSLGSIYRGFRIKKNILRKNFLFFKEIYYDSKTIFATQRALYQWFDDSLVDPQRSAVSVERLTHFKTIVDEFRINGRIDSGTKITFLSLLRDVDSLNFYKLRRVVDEMKNKKKSSKRSLFLAKIVKLKFDLSLCSAKEFTELINKIDNCAIKYIQVTNNCKIVMRGVEHLTLRHFMGQVDATIESSSEKNLNRAELSLKRLADAVHYRLVKQLPSCDTMSNFGSNKNAIGSYSHFKVLLQSPPANMATSQLSSLNESKIDLSSSIYSQETTSNATTDLTNTTSSSINKAHKKTVAKSKPSKKVARDSISSANSTLNGNNNTNDSFLDLSHNSMGTTTPLTSSPMSSSSNHSPFKFKIKTVTKKTKSPSQQHVEREVQLPKAQKKPFTKSPNKASPEPKENFYTINKYNGYNNYQNDKEYNYNFRHVNYNNVDRCTNFCLI